MARLGASFANSVRVGVVCAILAPLLANSTAAEIYAAVVMDARNGEVLFSRHGNKIRYPASLTKMMTLYLAIEAIEAGEIDLDSYVTISSNAASEPPSKIGLRAGQRKTLRHLMRAAAIRSANDAATAIAEAISGSEEAFTRRMTRTARTMGMRNTTFHNAHGLTQAGHRSTAYDMAILSRHIIYDYPEYFNLFSRLSADIGGSRVRSTNRRFLQEFRGADGIKTGYTSASMFNLAATARRGNKRLIVIVLGGRSVVTRDNHVIELMNNWFHRMPAEVALRTPQRPNYRGTARLASRKIESADHRIWRPTSDGDMQPYAIIAASLEAGDDNSIEEVTAVGIDPAFLPYELPVRRPRRIALEHFGVSESNSALVELGVHSSRNAAQRRLMAAALADPEPLIAARKQVTSRDGKFVSRFIGIEPEVAENTCMKLAARGMSCKVVVIH